MCRIASGPTLKLNTSDLVPEAGWVRPTTEDHDLAESLASCWQHWPAEPTPDGKKKKAEMGDQSKQFRPNLEANLAPFSVDCSMPDFTSVQSSVHHLILFAM